MQAIFVVDFFYRNPDQAGRGAGFNFLQPGNANLTILKQLAIDIDFARNESLARRGLINDSLKTAPANVDWNDM